MNQAEASSGQARIYDQGYKPFRGPLASVNSRFVAIARNELRQAWKNKWFRRLVWIAFFPLIVVSVILIIQQKLGDIVNLGNINVMSEFWDTQQFFAMIAVYHTGRCAVGEDLRTGALTVFFSRPVSFTQYLLGKWLAIAGAVVMVTFVPGFALALLSLIIGTTSFVGMLQTILALILLCVLTCLCFGWVMMGISSLAGRGRAAGIAWVLAFFFTPGIAAGVAEATGSDAFHAIGWSLATSKLAEILLGNHTLDESVAVNMAGLLLWAALGFLVVLFRLRRWMGT